MMESIQLLVQGVPAAVAGSSEPLDNGQSLDGAEAAGFTSLLVSLLSPQQPMPEMLAAIPVAAEGAGQAVVSQLGAATGSNASLSAAFSLIRPGLDTTDSLVMATRTAPVLDAVPVKGGKTAQPAPAEEATVQQVLPEASILLKMVPVSQGTALDAGFKLETVKSTGNPYQPNAKEGPVQVISVPLSAVENGEIVLPLQLPTGQQVTLLLKDLPAGDSATRATGQDRKLEVAPAKSSLETRETVSLGIPAASGDVIKVILQVKPSPAAQQLPTAAGENRKESGDVIRVILQVKPSTPLPVQATRVEPAAQVPATDNGNRVVLQARPSMPLPAETMQAAAAMVMADTTPELQSAESAVSPVRKLETGQHRGEAGNVGFITTVEAEPLPAANQAMDVKAKAAPEIRVLNQSSRPVEIVMQQEPANGQAVVESVRRSAGTSEKSPVAETGGSEAALPGKPAKGTLVADAVTGKETVSTVASPSTAFSDKVAEVAAQAKPEVSANDLIDQVVQKVSSANRNIPSEVTVKLQPEHLGNLQMKVAVEGEQVAVKIHVESPLAKQMLENNLGQLRESLGSVGLRMDSISVSLGMNTGWERGQNPLWQDGRGQNAYPAMHREAEPRRQEQPIVTPRAYPVKVDRLLDMTI